MRTALSAIPFVSDLCGVDVQWFQERSSQALPKSKEWSCVNDFRLPFWLQELLQAPFCFLWAQPVGREVARSEQKSTEKLWLWRAGCLTQQSRGKQGRNTQGEISPWHATVPKKKNCEECQVETVKSRCQRWLASRVTASIQKHCITPSKNFNHPGINSSQSSMMNTRRTVELDVIAFLLLCLRRIKKTTGHSQQCTQKPRVGPQRWNASQRDG